MQQEEPTPEPKQDLAETLTFASPVATLARTPQAARAALERQNREALRAYALIEERGQLRLRFALRILVLAIVLEGALRKWVFPGSNDILYFTKDVALAFVYATAIFARRTEPARPPTRAARFAAGAFALLSFCVILSAISPGHPDGRVALLGVRAYLFYPPLLLVVPRAYVRRDDLVRDALRLGWVLAAMGLLVLVQVVSPKNSFVNRYAWLENARDDIATAGRAVRATGTFSFIWPLVDFVLFAGAIVTPLFFLARTPSQRLASALGTLGAVTCAVGSGSRAAAILVAMMLLGATATAMRRGLPGARRMFQLMVGFAVAVSVSGALQESVAGLSSRAVSSKDASSRTFLYALEYTPLLGISFAVSEDVPTFGEGVGVGQHSASRFLTNRRALSGEFEGPIVVYELGVSGLIAHYAFRTGVVLVVVGIAVRAARERRGIELVFAATAATVLATAFPRTCITDPVNAILTYLLASTAVAFSRARSEPSPAPVSLRIDSVA